MSITIKYHDDLEKLAPLFSDPAGVSGVDRIPEPLREFVRELLKAARAEWSEDVWAIFDTYREKRILTVGWWIFRFTVRVKHCGALIALLVGPRPRG